MHVITDGQSQASENLWLPLHLRKITSQVKSYQDFVVFFLQTLVSVKVELKVSNKFQQEHFGVELRIGCRIDNSVVALKYMCRKVQADIPGVNLGTEVEKQVI